MHIDIRSNFLPVEQGITLAGKFSGPFGLFYNRRRNPFIILVDNRQETFNQRSTALFIEIVAFFKYYYIRKYYSAALSMRIF